jgi:hypothetical protein
MSEEKTLIYHNNSTVSLPLKVLFDLVFTPLRKHQGFWKVVSYG